VSDIDGVRRRSTETTNNGNSAAVAAAWKNSVIDGFRPTDQLALLLSLTSLFSAPHLSVGRTKLDSRAELFTLERAIDKSE